MNTRKHKNPLVRPKAPKAPRKKSKSVSRAKLTPKPLYTIADEPNQESLERLHTILEERTQREVPLSRNHLIKYTSKKQNSLRPMRKSYRSIPKLRKELTNKELRAKMAHNLNNMHKGMFPIRTTRYRQEENKFNELTNQELREKMADNLNHLNKAMVPIRMTRYKQEHLD